MNDAQNIDSEVKEKKTSLKEDLFDWIESIVISVFVVILIFTFVLRIIEVDGESMVQTLHHRDRLITTHLFYKPSHGDIIVLNSTGLNKPIVKRVIGIAGDEINIDFEEGIVYRNGEALTEPYTNTPTNAKESINFPITVEEGKVFVLGDNRNSSTDSRSARVGQVDEEQILGKVIFRIYPFSDLGLVK
ncbi:MAG: signal peptidase I [Clostridiales bacterium]|mgnify:CR=1 FL=1|nr:signal peptidase I [Clostridiales bacterium]